MKQLWKYIFLTVGIIILDQITKGIIKSNFILGESIPVIEGFFNITFVKNPGAAFGFFADARDEIRKPLMLITPVAVSVWLVFQVRSTYKKNSLLTLAYCLIIAGAMGNFIDRFAYSYVIDFLDFHYNNVHFPAFNVADSAITIAAGLLILDLIIIIKQERKSTKKNQ